MTVSLEDLATGPKNIVDETRLNDVNANRSPNQAEVPSTLDNAVGSRALPNEATNNMEEFETNAVDEMQSLQQNKIYRRGAIKACHLCVMGTPFYLEREECRNIY